MNEYRQMVNDVIRIGLAKDITNMRRLSMLSYKEIERYKVPGCYKAYAITRAAGILSSRKSQSKEGILPRILM